jgi:L-amino acid N-acyltransferase YncA
VESLGHEEARTELTIAAGPGPLDPETTARIAEIMPSDRLRVRRLANLAVAYRIAVARDRDRPVGVAYVRSIYGIPNVTWIVAEDARRQGIASRLVVELQKECRVLTAMCRSDVSAKVARRTGFHLTVGGLAWWIAGRRR